MARRQCTFIVALIFLIGCMYTTSRIARGSVKAVFDRGGSKGLRSLPLHQHPLGTSGTATQKQAESVTTKPGAEGADDVEADWDALLTHGQESTPKTGQESRRHPIQDLIDDARRAADEVTKRQSRDLKQAVKEYRRRYGIPPPPKFDKWFKFAQANHVQLVDEFDMIHELMTPFWGLKPKTIRARTREALGYDNALIGVAIREHRISHMDGGTEWQQNVTRGMLHNFLEYLPDMDLAFNMHDEPRVIVPHGDLTRLVSKAQHEHMPAAEANRIPVNDFSKTSPELSNKMVFEQVKHTRFNSLGRQATWTHSRMSCSPDSPARTLEDDETRDDTAKSGVGELGFVSNWTAMTDICLSPSLSATHGFFNGPNTYKVVHDLFPVFSQSKISSHNDILYPSPWYWSDKVPYKQQDDRPWNEKHSALYWRGSTTGGFSRDGGWRRQHRQRFVKKINAGGRAHVMTNTSNADDSPSWAVTTVSRSNYGALTDVAFSHVGQCDPGDCQAQQAFFNITPPANQTEAWSYKYLLDMDGNAFSGRFLAFLKSASLTFKYALFREWHAEWLTPWVHYVPLSLHGDDWLETVRFFSDERSGADDAEQMARDSRVWAAKALRKEDMEAWFFRLLLEYARVIDDQRAVIGFDPLSSAKRL